MDKTKEAFDNLLTDCVGLYVNGVLVQYGISEEQALEIVANLTKLPKERLVELKQSRDNRMSEQFSKVTDNVLYATRNGLRG